MYTNTVNP